MSTNGFYHGNGLDRYKPGGDIRKYEGLDLIAILKLCQKECIPVNDGLLKRSSEVCSELMESPSPRLRATGVRLTNQMMKMNIEMAIQQHSANSGMHQGADIQQLLIIKGVDEDSAFGRN